MVMINRRHFLMLAAAATFGATLSGCATDTPIAGPVPELGFQHLPIIRLDVSDVLVRSAYQSPLKAPNAEHLFATTPAQAMSNWAKARLQPAARPATGSNGAAVANFIIEDASVIETKLGKTKGVKGLFTYEPTERYDAKAAARLEIRGRESGAYAEVRVSASRSVEVRENATLAERERAWFDMTEALMGDFNAQMEKEIDSYLARWIVTAGRN